jgi:hypothetical protein
MDTIMDVENPIVAAGPQRHRLPAERLANADRAVPETDPAIAVDLANDVARPILDRRQTLAEYSRTGAITQRRRPQAERFVRPLMIVNPPPPVERTLTRHQIGKAVAVAMPTAGFRRLWPDSSRFMR